jgi:hypothetical protein
VAAVLLIWLLTGWLSYFMARHEAEELMDGSLAQTGHLLLAIIEDDEDELAGLASRLARVRRADERRLRAAAGVPGRDTATAPCWRAPRMRRCCQSSA